jgi:hypothetical protein
MLIGIIISHFGKESPPIIDIFALERNPSRFSPHNAWFFF